MKKLTAIIAISISLSSSVFCQKIILPENTFHKVVDSTVNNMLAICRTSDSGFVLTYQNYKQSSFMMMNVTNSGELKWVKTIGDNRTNANSVQQTSDKGFIIAGEKDVADYNRKGGYIENSDFWVVKFDSVGNKVWEKLYGGSAVDKAHDVKQTKDGGYIVVGETFSTDREGRGNRGLSDFLILKLSGTGEIEWKKTYGSPVVAGLSSGNDRATAVELASDGGYVVGGTIDTWYKGLPSQFYSDVKIDKELQDNSGNDCWIIKLNSKGLIQWQRALEGHNEELLSSIDKTTDDGYLISGNTSSSDGDFQGMNSNNSRVPFLVKLSAIGDVEWKKTLVDTSSLNLGTVKEIMDGNFIIAGTQKSAKDFSYDGAFVIKMDKSGTIIWKQHYLYGSKVFENMDSSFTTIDNIENAKFIVGRLEIPKPPVIEKKPTPVMPKKKQVGQKPITIPTKKSKQAKN